MTTEPKAMLTEDQIKYMVDRFLGWRLPEHFSPDCGISFKADFNEHTAHPAKHQPVGTNVFSAAQADAMVRYMIEGMNTRTAAPAGADTAMREALISARSALDNPLSMTLRERAYEAISAALSKSAPEEKA